MQTPRNRVSHFFSILIFFLFLAFPLYAQLGNYQNPPGIAWMVIDTPHFEIIFPQEIERDAQRVANILEHIFVHVSMTLRHEPKKVSVILQTQTTVSNGFTTFLPRHIEFFNVPMQESLMGPIDWYSLLAVHELRHLVQFGKTNQGFMKALYYIFGSVSQALSFLLIPQWFWEGDAVCTETALTNSGRGRQPSFDVEFRALLLSGKRYPYYKAMFGSYKDWDPLSSPYLLGYYLVSYVRRKYAADVWSNVLSSTSKYPFLPHMFSRRMKSEIGRGAPVIYEDTLDELEKLWLQQIEGLKFTEAKILHKFSTKAWTYNFAPQYIDERKVILLRVGQENIPQFILVDTITGKEQKLFDLGQINSWLFSVGGNKVVWTELSFDPRWWYRDYSIIKIYDLKTGQRKTLTRKSRYFAPSLSPDVKWIATVEFNSKNECNLVLLDAETGLECKRFSNPENELIQNPRWSPDSSYLVFGKIHPSRGKAISLMNVESGESEDIIPYSHLDVHAQVTDGKYIYFVSPYSGIDNIYAADVITKKVYQVTSRKFGAYFPSLSHDAKKLAFNDVTADGYLAVEMPIKSENWIPIEKVEDRNIRYYEPLIPQESEGNILENIPNKKYEVKKFNEFSHLINIHSWVPMADTYSKLVSLSLFSLNLLGTMESLVSYEYNGNEKTHHISLDGMYGGWFPILALGLKYGGRTSSYEDNNDNVIYYSWQEETISGGVQLPFNLTKGLYRTELLLGVNARWTKISGLTVLEEFENNNGTFLPMTYDLHFSRGYQWTRDINPVWGQTIDLSYSHTPFKEDYQGSLFSAQGTFFFPGLLPHHSFFVQLGYENQKPQNYRFENMMFLSRGYSYEFNDTLYKFGLSYTLPLFYPDWNFLQILHFKRLISNFFFDYTEGKSDSTKQLYRSAGVELLTDLNIFTVDSLTFRVGVQFSYLFDAEKAQVGLVLKI